MLLVIKHGPKTELAVVNHVIHMSCVDEPFVAVDLSRQPLAQLVVFDPEVRRLVLLFKLHCSILEHDRVLQAPQLEVFFVSLVVRVYFWHLKLFVKLKEISLS